MRRIDPIVLDGDVAREDRAAAIVATEAVPIGDLYLRSVRLNENDGAVRWPGERVEHAKLAAAQKAAELDDEMTDSLRFDRRGVIDQTITVFRISF